MAVDMFPRTNGLIFRGLADYLTSIWSNRAMWSDIYTLTTVNVMDIICTSLGGENHGMQRRCKKNKGAYK